MKKLSRSTGRRTVAGGLLLSCALLAGCSSEAPNYEGTGNEFIVRGVVSDAEDDGLVQIGEDHLVVVQATGRAATWFADKDGQELFGEEFDFLSRFDREPGGWLSCGDEQNVGRVVDQFMEPIEPEQLLPGDVVEITGSIRDHAYYQSSGKGGYCTNKELAVYTVIQVVDGPIAPVS